MSKQKVGRWAAALLATGVLSVMAAGCVAFRYTAASAM